MPHTRLKPSVLDATDHTPATRGVEVHVSWNPHQGVQIGTVYPSGVVGINRGEDEPPEILDDAVNPGWFADLDRRGINRLIRELRRARDGAYGRDE